MFVWVQWPTKLRKLLSRAAGDDARARAESAERNRWLQKLKVLIMEAELLVNSLMVSGVSGDTAWVGIGQGLRARTLRKSVRGWTKASHFVAVSCGHPWPKNIVAMLEYIEVLIGGGAPPSSVRATVYGESGRCRVGAVVCAYLSFPCYGEY